MTDKYFGDKVADYTVRYGVRSGAVGPLDVLLRQVALDAQRDQAIADCKAVCELCAAGRPLDLHIYAYHMTTEDDHGGCCDADTIRAAWRASHNEELP